MATLYLEHVNRSIPSLREWLDGKWGLLLSHPADFEDQSLERDRWIEVLRDAFTESGVRPIAYRRDGGEPHRGWVGEVSRAERVRLTRCEVIDIAARRLRDQLVSMSTTRFVAIVDPVLRYHAVLSYGCRARGRANSPLDLLALVSGVRRRHGYPANDRFVTTEHDEIAVA